MAFWPEERLDFTERRRVALRKRWRRWVA